MTAPAHATSSHHTRGVWLMLLSTAAFTTNVLLVRAIAEVEAVNVWLVAITRFVIGLALLFTLYRRQLQFARLFRHGRLASRGIVGGAGVYTYYLTVVHLGAGRAGFIGNTYVIFAALLAVWMLRERFGPGLALGGAVALVGLGLLTNPFASGSDTGWWDLLAIITALASAYVVVTIRELHATEHTATIFASQCVYGLLICGAPAIALAGRSSAAGWALMLLAAIAAAVGQLAMTRAFRDLRVAEGSLLQMLVPLGIAVGGVALFGEHFTLAETIGAALILAGTAYTVVRR
ncbi:MAG TPA: DMT family transporter [Opitutaceae bacterium]|nr:DMT family transporter [Opitutaceae bacterium]